MKKVILDTNFLMLPAQMFDIFSKLEELMQEPYVLVVLSGTIDELEKLADGKSKKSRDAKLGLALLRAKLQSTPTLWERLIGLVPYKKERKIRIVKSKGHVDDAIVELADKNTVVATLDNELKKRLSCQTISLAQKKLRLQ